MSLERDVDVFDRRFDLFSDDQICWFEVIDCHENLLRNLQLFLEVHEKVAFLDHVNLVVRARLG